MGAIPGSAAQDVKADQGKPLPRVLLIGDSICGGYHRVVQKELAGKAHVVKNPGNAQHTGTGLEKLDEWLGEGKWDVIHFNWGLWDMYGWRYAGLDRTPSTYEKRLEALVARLKKTNARLIWGATTPACPGPEKTMLEWFKTEVRISPALERRYRDAALRVMKKHNVPVNDLHALVLPELEKYSPAPDNVHFTGAGYSVLGKQVAKAILTQLTSPHKKDRPDVGKANSRSKPDSPQAIAGMPKDPAAAGLTGEPYRQYVMLLHDLARRTRFLQLAEQAYDRESLVLESDRDPLDIVLRRTAALLAHVQTMPKAPDLTSQAGKLQQLVRQANAADVRDLNARAALFVKACRLRRTIAFANPLLKFDKLLFLKRHLATYRHMCDQYYGIRQRPGGGICVLNDPFSDNPSVTEILKDAVVQNGRLKGKKLQNGSFLSPDLSYDGKRIAFAWVECTGSKEHRHHLEHDKGHWDPGWSYHIFTANIDTSTGSVRAVDLVQLTDGAFNDFDPCFMPSGGSPPGTGGRIAFITERRGGYLRCGRVCPTYTLYDMADDGSDIRCLSWHETNEWHPSVNNAGMIVWTRWDYVDRHGVVAHMPWLTTPDGRNPRPIHGNYSLRSSRPDMEQDVRAIPGSRLYAATAAPHHNQSYGSLIVVDPRENDDDGWSPLRRLTPRAEFPESQASSRLLSYGQAWPLSEDYFLCMYAPYEVKQLGGVHALYLLDRFGNQELIYRDESIACHNPMPLRARPRPPIVPDASERPEPGQPVEATVAVVDVYRSQFEWPENTKIKALRVYQIYPLSVASAKIPHATGMQVTETMSVNLARAVLGTAPVEEDGSAHFTVPAQKELFFQALDENGLAVTSMRSGAHFQSGERAVCQGCHEPTRHVPARVNSKMPIAMGRPPSRLKPDVDGTNPFSYPRLVQPVLERNCVACHKKNADKAPRLDAEVVLYTKSGYMNPKTLYYASY
ncbi:hypothetical protein HQ560_20985, partial [bacterium]|nr:hypothetical protein [bacterium]